MDDLWFCLESLSEGEVNALLAVLAEIITDDQVAEEAYRDMLAHPETVVDAFDLFD